MNFLQLDSELLFSIPPLTKEDTFEMIVQRRFLFNLQSINVARLYIRCRVRFDELSVQGLSKL